MCLFSVFTPQDNLAEDQNRRLCQHSRRGAVDATAKPNRAEKERIDKLIIAVSNHMTTEDIDLLYRYVYYFLCILCYLLYSLRVYGSVVLNQM